MTRAFGVHAATLEQLHLRGVADELVATGARARTLQLFDTVHVDLRRLPSPCNYLLITPQSRTEQVLRDRARSAGAETRSGLEVTGLRQDADGVTLAGRRQDGWAVELHAAYVVGADGVHSTVRRALRVRPAHPVGRALLVRPDGYVGWVGPTGASSRPTPRGSGRRPGRRARLQGPGRRRRRG